MSAIKTPQPITTQPLHNHQSTQEMYSYLGTFIEDETSSCCGYDLYINTNCIPHRLIARYGEEGHEYYATSEDAYIESAPLIEAKKRAIENNFLIRRKDGKGMFPTVDIWNRWIQKDKDKEGRVLSDYMHQDLDMTNWKDRFILFCRVTNCMPLEIDSRPKYRNFMKSVKERIIKEGISSFEEFCEMWSNPLEKMREETFEWNKEQFLGLLNDGWEMTVGDGEDSWTTYSSAFMTIAHLAYSAEYPRDKSISKTTVGKCADKYLRDADHSLIREYVSNLITELCAMVELIYQSSVALKEQGENLFLLKSQIDWENLFDMRDRINQAFWFYREWGSVNTIGDICNPFRGDNELHWNYTEFIIDQVFYLITKTYSVNGKDYLKRNLQQSYGMDWWYSDKTPDLDCFFYEEEQEKEVLSDDYQKNISDLSIYKEYVSKYGSIV